MQSRLAVAILQKSAVPPVLPILFLPQLLLLVAFPARLSTKIILPAVNIGCFRPSSHESKMTGNTYNVS